jgi:hypothetical protein
LITGGTDGQGCDEAFLPYRRLAMHVLGRAIRDLENGAGSATDRESARVFLAGSPMLFHWCRVAALDPRLVTRHAATHAVLSTNATEAVQLTTTGDTRWR